MNIKIQCPSLKLFKSQNKLGITHTKRNHKWSKDSLCVLTTHVIPPSEDSNALLLSILYFPHPTHHSCPGRGPPQDDANYSSGPQSNARQDMESLVPDNYRLLGNVAFFCPTSPSLCCPVNEFPIN